MRRWSAGRRGVSERRRMPGSTEYGDIRFRAKEIDRSGSKEFDLLAQWEASMRQVVSRS